VHALGRTSGIQMATDSIGRLLLHGSGATTFLTPCAAFRRQREEMYL